ncbi:hypothetical protein UFOVP23_2 [uncultured Caudovirales phage]|uniref:Uncharacterized protein n=1 Tax=uncultured Caudovirales phage TaxID=2100421 RepID=A0A6J5T7B0_9CAUD|nr:hypothetical protein UFOVP23_2 [uncultured Caudovirales phage]
MDISRFNNRPVKGPAGRYPKQDPAPDMQKRDNNRGDKPGQVAPVRIEENFPSVPFNIHNPEHHY